MVRFWAESFVAQMSGISPFSTDWLQASNRSKPTYTSYMYMRDLILGVLPISRWAPIFPLFTCSP